MRQALLLPGDLGVLLPAGPTGVGVVRVALLHAARADVHVLHVRLRGFSNA